MTVEDEVRHVFDSGLNCAESLLLVVSKYSGLEKDSARFIPRIATGFGGGIARNGDVCGALSGGDGDQSCVWPRQPRSKP